MNEVSIIINGVRYDSVDSRGRQWCHGCELFNLCCKYDHESTDLCYKIFGIYRVFKKSNKSFEL